MKNHRSVSPGTVEIIRNQLANVSKEMQASVMNSAYSSMWQEGGDLSCGLLNPSGEIISQSDRAIPIHIATMTSSARAAIEGTGGIDAIQDGDILIQNDPYAGNNHLNDFILFTPVFDTSTLLGFSAVRAHWLDVGGTTPTSYSTNTGELIQEGLRIPPSKLYDAGIRNDDLYELILSNVRERDDRQGDFNAQFAGVHRGHDRFITIIDKYGAPTVQESIRTILDNEEARMKTRITELPDGVYEATDYIDGDGVETTNVKIHATIKIDGDQAHVDFTGTDDQCYGGVNAPIAVTRTATYYAFKVTLDPGEPGTSGSYRPISVSAPSGTLVNPEFPAPVVVGNHETADRIYSTVVKAIAEIDPNLAFGAGEGSGNGFSYYAPETGEMNRIRNVGGSGACLTCDGFTVRSSVGNTQLQSFEYLERNYPFVTTEMMAIRSDSGGAGRFRGGTSARRITRFDTDVTVSLTAERATARPYGLAGGEAGESATHLQVLPDGTKRTLPSKTVTEFPSGSRFVFDAAGGGGFGDPTTRPPEKVLTDVENGYVSIEQAKQAYHVVITEETLTIDQNATDKLRNSHE